MALRETLRARNGLPDLDKYIVTDGPADAVRAAEIFREHGFVIIKDALSGPQVEALLQGCQREGGEILSKDPVRVGNRGGGRYSLGEAQVTGHLLHRKEWAMLADLDTVTPVLREIFGEKGYVCAGAGGDFVVDRVAKYQNLHADINERGCYDREDAPVVTVNVTTCPLTWENGPTRVIPGTHRPPEGSQARSWQPPGEDEEGEDWKLSTLCPLPAGCAIVRDNRLWHAGTPNLSATARYLPNCEFAATWWCRGKTHSLQRNQWVEATPCMPRSIYEGLSDHGKEICRLVVTDDEPECGIREDFGCEYMGHAFLTQTRRAPPAAQRQLRELMTGLPPGPEGDAPQEGGGGAPGPEPAPAPAPSMASEAVYFGTHREWCDHVVFQPDGGFECARGLPGRPGAGRWRLDPASSEGELQLELCWEGQASERLCSSDGGASFAASGDGVALLSRCGSVSLAARGTAPQLRRTPAAAGRLCGVRGRAGRLGAAALALASGLSLPRPAPLPAPPRPAAAPPRGPGGAGRRAPLGAAGRLRR